MALLDLQALELNGCEDYGDYGDRDRGRRCASDLSLLLCC
ncbi:MAG: SapB/AmfS family lanthipeptide [Pseudonocardiales bacterium]|nr:SapB/AmfS family lanthipeptide [Pseudonocardiales bacterium]